MQLLVILTSCSSVHDKVGAAVANQGGVDFDLAHVVDDASDAKVFAVVQNMVEKRGLFCAEETGRHCYGQSR